MIRRSYLPALALCTVVWGPASADSFSEVVDQGSYSATGDIYSQGMTAQGGPWAGDTYSQGMMMSNGQIYSLGMTLTLLRAIPQARTLATRQAVATLVPGSVHPGSTRLELHWRQLHCRQLHWW